MAEHELELGPAVETVRHIMHSGAEGRNCYYMMDAIAYSDERNNTMDVLVGSSFAAGVAIRYPM